MQKLSGVSAFFPAYNDAGTIPSMVMTALLTLPQIADDYEVIVGNDGSRDHTGLLLDELARAYHPHVRVMHHPKNLGYGGNLRSGFAAAQKEWVFYTDGDAQYDPREMVNLWRALREAEAHGIRADVANGWKISRNDPINRKIIGRLYHHIVKLMFGFKLRDVDCDFRLIRRSLFDEVPLTSTSGSICLEMVKKFQDHGAVFVETPVSHFHRAYGVSQFFNFRRLWRTFIEVSRLWVALVLRRDTKP
jgi:glycosyltransferase involved in cell wall biosynthesis